MTRSDNQAIAKVQIAAGYDDDNNGFDSSDVANTVTWRDITNGSTITSYQAVDGTDSFSISLTAGRNYYTSLRLIDNAGNVSNVVTSSAWQYCSTIRTLHACWTPEHNSLTNYYQMEESSWSGVAGEVLNSLETTGGQAVGNATTGINGYLGRKGTFDGSGDYVIAPNSVNSNGSYTVATWVNINTLGVWQSILAQDGNNVSSFSLQITNANKFSFALLNTDANSTAITRAVSTFSATAGTWYHVVGVYDATADIGYLYVNGELAAQASFSTAWASSGSYIIGAAKWNGNRVDYFNGAIDELATWSKALSASQVLEIYEQQNATALSYQSALDVGTPYVTTTIMADFNGDGLTDIAALEGGKHASGNKLLAWFEAPSWTKHDFNSSITTLPFLGSAASADIDVDGDMDLVFSEDYHSGGTVAAKIWWLENPGHSVAATTNWTPHLIADFDSSAAVEHINDMLIQDMDGDGKLDIIYRHFGTLAVKISFQDTTTTWTTRSMTLRSREGMCIGDVDRDGKKDIILNGFWWSAPTNPRVDSYTEYIIDSSFYSQPVTGLNNSSKCGFADIDGDGYGDVVLSTAEGATGKISLYKAPANPRTQSWTEIPLESNVTGAHQVQIADFNNDGYLDIMSGLAFSQTGVFIFMQNASYTNWNKVVINASQGLYSGVIGDIDNDGDLDIAGPTAYAGRLYLYENNLDP